MVPHRVWTKARWLGLLRASGNPQLHHPLSQHLLGILCGSASHRVLGEHLQSPPHSKDEGFRLAPPGCTSLWVICLRQPQLCPLGRGGEEGGGGNSLCGCCRRTHRRQNKRKWVETAVEVLGADQRKEVLSQVTGKLRVLGCQLTSSRRRSWVSQSCGHCGGSRPVLSPPHPLTRTQSAPGALLHITVKCTSILYEEYRTLLSFHQRSANI